MTAACGVGECGRAVKASGLCNRHYIRWFRYGDPATRVRGEVPAAERFWRFVNKRGPYWRGTRCWLWRGALTRDGYGHFHLNGKMVRAHRFSYEERHGPITGRRDLDHLCRRRACVRPEHHEPVSRAVNTRRGALARKAA